MGLSFTFCISRSIQARRDCGFSRRKLIPIRREMPDMENMRHDCLISAAPASWGKPHLSNYKAFLDDDVTAERRYAAIEKFNYR